MMRYWLIAYLSINCAYADGMVMLPLQYRTLDEVLPVLQPLLSAGETLTGMNDQLIVRASASHLADIKAVLARIDTAPRQLVIYVRQNMNQQQQRNDLNINGRASVGGVAVSVPNNQRPNARLSHDGINLDVQNSQRDSVEQADQMVRVMDGGVAHINAGVSVPVPIRQVVYGANGAVISTSTVYQDFGSSFYVTPHLIGERVSLDISPQQTSLQTSQYGSRNVQRLSTSVQTKLGVWTQIGGTDTNNTQNAAQLLGQSAGTQQSQQGVWLKVVAE
ncbi:MAG: hypothetical protein HOP20_06280 [Sulfuriferula sp.]|nr:hypothetical protein [Sulfuriferula sp.]